MTDEEASVIRDRFCAQVREKAVEWVSLLGGKCISENDPSQSRRTLESYAMVLGASAVMAEYLSREFHITKEQAHEMSTRMWTKWSDGVDQEFDMARADWNSRN